MMPKELLKENSPIKKHFENPKNNIPSNSKAMNFKVSVLVNKHPNIILFYLYILSYYRRLIVLLFQKCHA